MLEVAPPTTYEIYATNQTSRDIRNSFAFTCLKENYMVPRALDVDLNIRKKQFTTLSMNLKNPLMEYSFRLAKSPFA